MRPKLSVVIGTYNRRLFLERTLESLRPELEDVAAEVFVIDGGSSDGTIEWLVRQRDVIAIVQHNRGEWRGRAIPRKSWGYFVNLGFKAASGEYVGMLSDDCLVIPGAMQAGMDLFDRAREARNIGAVAFYWRNWPEQKPYWVGLTLGRRLFVNHGLYLRDALKDVGFADDETYSFYHADGDLCLKLWESGYEVIDSPHSYVEHYSHANEEVRAENLAVQQSDWANYHAKWTHLADPDEDWIEREFDDPARTAERLWADIASGTSRGLPPVAATVTRARSSLVRLARRWHWLP
jgi:GT2 family glycosyltransferase